MLTVNMKQNYFHQFCEIHEMNYVKLLVFVAYKYSMITLQVNESYPWPSDLTDIFNSFLCFVVT